MRSFVAGTRRAGVRSVGVSEGWSSLIINDRIDIRGQPPIAVQNGCKPTNHDIPHVQAVESLEDRDIERYPDIIG